MKAFVLSLIMILIGLNCQAQSRIPLEQLNSENAIKGQFFSIPEIRFDFDRSYLLVRKDTTRHYKGGIKYAEGKEDSASRPELIIFYPFNSIDSIKILANKLKEYPTLVIEVGGHTDCRYSDKYSRCLSCRRAKEVCDELVRQGIQRERLISKGFNDTRPLPGLECDKIEKFETQEEKEIAYQKLRRIEIRILSSDYDPVDGLFRGYGNHRDLSDTSNLYVGREFLVNTSNCTFYRNVTCPDFISFANWLEANAEIEIKALSNNQNNWLNRITRIQDYLFFEYKIARERFKIDTTKNAIRDENSIRCTIISNTSMAVPVLFKGTNGKRDIYDSTRVQTGDEFYLDINYYDSRFSKPTDNSLEWLKSIIADYSNLELHIEVYTDCRGSDKYNLELSKRRAKSIVNYLENEADTMNKIIVPIGKGETAPLNGMNCDEINSIADKNLREEKHAENRKTIARIVSIK